MKRKVRAGLAAGVTVLGLLGAGTATAAAPQSGDGTARVTAGDIPKGISVTEARNSKYVGLRCDTSREKLLRSDSGHGPGNLVVTVSNAVTAENTSTVGVSIIDVSTEVGFNVSRSYTVEDQIRFEVPRGHKGYVEAYPCYQVYHYDVWSDGRFGMPRGYVGRGVAKKPIGVHFKAWSKRI